MNKIFVSLLVVLMFVSNNVNGCGRPCAQDSDCDVGCCTGCCPGNFDCSIKDDGGAIIGYQEANICGGCPPDTPTTSQDICSLPKVVGPCRADFRRWYYNGDKCVQFTFGGCRGNENNFETEVECLQACDDSCDEYPDGFIPIANGECKCPLQPGDDCQENEDCCDHYCVEINGRKQCYLE